MLPMHLSQPQPIQLRRERLTRVLGTHIDDAEVARILTALGLMVEVMAEGWRVTPPTRRFDITIEEDLIEEVARIHGYDAIPAALPGGGMRLVVASEACVAEHDLETINYAFVDAGLLERFELSGEGVALVNPLSAELGVMRPSLLPGLVASLSRNKARQQIRVRLFEIGKTFAATVMGPAPIETRRIAAIACGDALAEQWGVPARVLDFHDMKGDLESLAALAGVRLDYRGSNATFAHPGRSAGVYRDDTCIGWIGQIHPRLQRVMDVDTEMFGFELDMGLLLAREVPRAGSMSKFPSVRRDLAFVVPESVSWAAMQATARQAAGQSMREVRLFDRYAGKGVETGFKSLAMGLILQDESRTLTDRDVEATVTQVVAALEQEHGAAIRR
jgi:phenylalanyl-tRNA synthetase beta chain